MAVLQLLSEETIYEENLLEYFDDLYRVVCVGERPPSGAVKSTYIVDWEQLVHLLEDYEGLSEDIVEVTPLSPEQAALARQFAATRGTIARA